MPASCEKILSSLGSDIPTDYESLQSFGGVKAGVALAKAEILFARIDEKKFLEEMEAKIAAAIEANKPIEEPEHEAEIGIDAFAAVELRVAEILAAEPIPKAKKLLKLQVDLGYEKRQVVSGIAKFYTPDELIGKKVCLVTNLKPAKLCGVDSFGMILASGEEDVKVVFLDPSAKNGDRIH
jgi:methionyl-tRNA synthetase